MKATTTALFALIVSVGVQIHLPFVSGSFTSLSAIDLHPDAPSISQNYIVELESSATQDTARKRSSQPHQDFYEELRRRDITISASTEWNNDDLFVGVEITIDTPAILDQILNTPGVVAIRQVTMMSVPPLINSQIVNGIHDPALPPDTQSSHFMTGVDKLHAEGNFGQGVKIGIIDTGVDYLNPTLGGGFGPGFVVQGGKDFVGDAYTGFNTPVPDNDPLDTCQIHGTHVAGIIAAQPGNMFNITGVAYKSIINAYRVFGCSGNAQDPVIINALIQAYEDGNDVITLSLGLASGWSSSTTSVVASRIAKKGRIVTASVGNDGALGAWYTGAPATGSEVISVGSVENIALPINKATLSDGTSIPYFSVYPLPIPGTLPIYATSTTVNPPDDACNPLPDSTPNLANYVVIIRRGGCPGTQKLTNAAAKGARYFLIYNDASAIAYINGGPYLAALIRAEDGAYLVNAFASGSNLKITFPQTGAAASVAADGGGLVSQYSTLGPSYDMQLKPSVVAPGGNILSTIPRALGNFALNSGTSMACPFVAGTAALIIKAKGRDRNTIRGIRTLMESTANPVPVSLNGLAPLHTAAQEGAGLINAYNSVHYKSVVYSGELLVNDTAYSNNFQFITLENKSSKSVTYTISHTPASTIQTVDKTIRMPYPAPIPTISQTASVTFSRTKITVSARSIGTFGVTIKPPAGVDAATFPVYSGFVGVSSSTGELFSIPYMGVASKMKDMTIIDTTNFFFGVPLPAVLDISGNIQTGPKTYTLVGNDYPTILYRRSAGTPSLLVDLVDKNTQLTTVSKRDVSKRGWLFDLISGFFGQMRNNSNGSFFKVKTVGSIFSSPYLARHALVNAQGPGYDFIRMQAFLNTTAIPNGDYKLLLRALKITGDRTKQEDYESWLSPVITVARP